MFASITASAASDFAPDTARWPRYREAESRLIAYTTRPVARSAATHRPRSVSIATGIGFSTVSPAPARISSWRASPSASLLTRSFTRTAPVSSMMAMS